MNGENLINDFHGQPTGFLENELLKIEYLLTAGPRVVRLGFKHGANMFAELPDVCASTCLGDYHFRGGHRLWRSPELMPESYMPDDDGLIVEQIENGVALTQQVESGISKKMEISLHPDQAVVTLNHHLQNTGRQTVELAAWPITMFRLGGVGIFPQNTALMDQAGLLPNRNLVLWPYTDIRDPRLSLANDFLLLQAIPTSNKLKIGYSNQHGWMGYFLDGALFIKSFSTEGENHHPDLGANCEFFCNDQVFELETLSPLTLLRQGEEVVHRETWQVFSELDQRYIPDSLAIRILEMVR